MSNSLKPFIKLRDNWLYLSLSFLMVLGIGFFLRVYNLLVIPIFVDEAIYLRWTQIMKAEPQLRFLPLTDGKQPLFMWVTMPFLKLFSDPLIAGRMVSVLCGLSSLAGIVLLAFLLFKSKKIALIAGLFYVISPYTVFFDRTALVDSMLAMFGIWALYFSILTVKYIRLDTALISGFFLGMAWLTKSPAVFFTILTAFTVLFPRVKKEKLLSTNLVKVIPLIGLSAFIGYAIYNLLRLGPSFHLIAIRNKDYLFTVQEVLNNPFIQFYRYGGDILEWMLLLLPFPVILLTVLAIWKGYKPYLRELIFLSIWFLIPLVVQIEFGKVLTARYLLFAVFPLFIIAALGFQEYIKLNPKTKILLLILIILPAIFTDFLLLSNPEKAWLPKHERAGFLEAWTSGTGIREVGDFIKIKHNENPERHILVGTEGYFGTLPDGLQIYIEDLPNVTVLGAGHPDIRELPPALINSKNAGDTVYFVVNESRLLEDEENLGIELIKKYPKAKRIDGSLDNLLLFEVSNKAIDVYNDKHAEKPKK